MDKVLTGGWWVVEGERSRQEWCVGSVALISTYRTVD